MTSLEDFERTISMLRAQATQMNLLADQMDRMLEPWRQLANISNAQQQWIDAWTQSLWPNSTKP